MVLAILSDVLEDPSGYEPNTVMFVPSGVHQVEPTTPVQLLRHGTYSEQDIEGHRYFLEAGCVSEIVDGLREHLGREPTSSKCFTSWRTTPRMMLTQTSARSGEGQTTGLEASR